MADAKTKVDMTAAAVCEACNGTGCVVTDQREPGDSGEYIEIACPECAPQPADVPHDVAVGGVVRHLTGETVLGFPVAAYRETHPEHGAAYGHIYSEHWSTPNSRNPKVTVERLFAEKHLRAALATPAPSTSTEEALRALIDETGSKDAENMADMARIGHACMEEIERLDRAYSNCPSEVIVDLANALDEAERGRDDAIATVLAADDTRQAATELGAENARLRAAAQAVLDAETVNVHVGYDNAAGGGNFVYADAIRTDDEAFTKLRTALSR